MFNNELWQKPAGGGGGGDFYTHQIANSERFNKASASYMTMDPNVGDNKTWAVSFWVKRTGLGNGSVGNNSLIASDDGSSGGGYSSMITFNNNDQISISTGTTIQLVTVAKFRDTSAFYHIVVAADTTDSTEGNRWRIYVNGVNQLVTGTYPAQNYGFQMWGNGADIWIGKQGSAPYTVFANFDIAEVAMTEGTAHNAGTFGELKNGVWIPKDLSGVTFGDEGFWLQMKNSAVGSGSSSTVGADTSGNNNHFTTTNLATYDHLLSSPTFGSSNGGNFATYNPLSPTTNGAVFTEGNLKSSTASNWSATTYIKTTMAIPKDKKIYFEASDAGSVGGLYSVGVAIETGVPSATLVGGPGAVTLYDQEKYVNGTGTSSWITGAVAGDIIQVAVDGATGKVWLGINNTWGGSGNPSAGSNEAGTITNTNNEDLLPVVCQNSASNLVLNFGQDGTFAGAKTAQGNADATGYGNFYYAPPTDFLALCTGNLTTAAAVDPAQTDDDYPQELFFMSQYTGNSTNRTITTENQPDLIFNRHWNYAQDWYVVDSTRVITDNKIIITNKVDAEATLPQGNFTSVGATSVGISSGSWLNSPGTYYQMWMWRANGGTTAANSVGGTSSVTQIDPSGGFSIVTYTGSGSATTIGHGLSVAPTMIFTKRIDSTSDWTVYQQYMNASPQTSYLKLSKGEAMGTGDSGYWNSTAPTSSVFSLGTANDVNASGGTYIAYCFANTEGYINARSYVGNANNDGTFVYTGFKPAFVMNKPLVTGNWRVVDNSRSPYNVTQSALSPNNNTAEDTYASVNIDLLSNGFKMRNSGTPMNQATNYIYLAFAQNPFQYATAR